MTASSRKSFGTAPVYFTAIATILGAILFLRFGFAVGTLGFWGVIGVILLGHMVTIPTALAILVDWGDDPGIYCIFTLVPDR